MAARGRRGLGARESRGAADARRGLAGLPRRLRLGRSCGTRRATHVMLGTRRVTVREAHVAAPAPSRATGAIGLSRERVARDARCGLVGGAPRSRCGGAPRWGGAPQTAGSSCASVRRRRARGRGATCARPAGGSGAPSARPRCRHHVTACARRARARAVESVRRPRTLGVCARERALRTRSPARGEACRAKCSSSRARGMCGRWRRATFTPTSTRPRPGARHPLAAATSPWNSRMCSGWEHQVTSGCHWTERMNRPA